MITFGRFDYDKIYRRYRSDISAIHISAHFGLSQVAQDLIQRGKDLNCKGSSLRTPLFYTAQRGHIEIVQLLLA